jgi:hypothetical protein
MTSVGTLEWTRRTGGRLSARDRLAYLASGVASQMAAITDRVAYATGVRRERVRLDLGDVRLPDTRAAREAEAVAEELPGWLSRHSHRSYLWAVALGRHDDVRFDEEELYVGSLLHDTGLPTAVKNGDSTCFTLESAARAEECARRADWPDARREHLAESITLHINPTVPTSQSVEGNLLARGSTLDGIALRWAWRMHPDTVRAVHGRHPRDGMKDEQKTLLRAHAKAAPQCRIAFLRRYGALDLLVARAPLGE